MKQLCSARSTTSWLTAGALGALAATAAPAVLAQEQGSSPYYLGASQGFTRDSNILRRSGASEFKDTISSTGVRAGIDQSFGRQRAVVGMELKRNRYNEYTQYNNTEYGANGRLAWETVGNLSGTLSVNTDRSLFRSTTTTSTDKNIQTNRGAAFQVVLGTVTRWSFDASLSTNRSTYSATNRLDIRQTGGGLGVRFRPSEALTLRTGARHTTGKYLFDGSGFDRDDVDFDSFVDLSGVSSLNTRLSWTKTSYERATARDFSGWTGSLGWTWRPTGKLQFDLTGTRDNSVGSVNRYAQFANDFSGDTLITNSIALRSAYELTSKIAFNAALSYARRTLDNSFIAAVPGSSFGVLGSGKDRTKIASLSFRYLPLRNVELGCGASWEDRDVSAPAGLTSTISFPYTARVYTCSGQVFLR